MTHFVALSKDLNLFRMPKTPLSIQISKNMYETIQKSIKDCFEEDKKSNVKYSTKQPGNWNYIIDNNTRKSNESIRFIQTNKTFLLVWINLIFSQNFLIKTKCH